MLTYHSNNVHENSYSGNDHIAFEHDLRLIDRLGLRIVPLATVVDWHAGAAPDDAVARAVALTLDDGSWLDYHDVMHPSCGLQAGMFRLLQEFRAELGPGRQPALHVSSFVITSPDARRELDRKNLLGQGWWGDDWWRDATASGLMSIECHSWDHVHETLERVAQADNVKGDFGAVRTLEDCRSQVQRAGDYIERTAGVRPAFFAYPWGQASDFMRRDYLPGEQRRHRFRAAFSIERRHLTRADDVWFMPRYVCGRDWRSPDELAAILLNAGSNGR